MEQYRKENDLGKDPIKKLVWRIAVPSMLAQFVSVLYSIVDRMYIGNISQVGDIALAGVGVCGPVITMIGSVSSLVGVGGAALMSIRMGEEDMPAARKILANSVLLLGVFSLFLPVIALVCRKPMLYAFGASGETFAYAEQYFVTYLCGTLFALLSVGLNQFIISQGFSKVAMFSVLIGAVLNIILDPIFIFVFNKGVQGAAIATVLSQIASCGFVLRFLLGERAIVRIGFGGYSWKVIRRILSIGFVPFIIIALDNVMIIAMNALLQKYGGAEQGDMLVTCATIAQSFMLVVTMPLGGISGGTQTILAYNYGARMSDRVLKAQKYIIMLCLGYTTLLFLLARLCGPLFVSLFTKDPALAEQAMWAIKVCTLAIIPLGIQYEIVDGFTAIGHVKISMFLSSFRKAVYFAALFLIPLFFPARSIFYAEAISDILGPLMSVGVYFICIKKILHRRAVGEL